MKLFEYLLIVVMFLPVLGNAQSVSIDTVKSAPGITVETAVDKSEIYIGDLINSHPRFQYCPDSAADWGESGGF